MTRHFNVGEAKAQLSKLIEAAVRGEDVVIDHAGKPRVRLVPLQEAVDDERERIIAKRKRFIASCAGLTINADTSPEGIRAMREYSPERRALYGLDD